MTDRQKLIAAILASLPALLLACSQWIKADAEAKEKAKAYESYGEYVTDQLHRDEALLRALRDCETLLRTKPGLWAAYRLDVLHRGQAQELGGVVGMARPDFIPDEQAQTVLDEIARREGWKTK
jgi:hypothetical protein